MKVYIMKVSVNRMINKYDSNIQHDSNDKTIECCISRSDELSVIGSDSNTDDFQKRVDFFVIENENRVNVVFQEVADIDVKQRHNKCNRRSN